MDDIVGQSVTAKISYADGEHCINGIVSRFVQTGTNLRFTSYFLELRPWLWMLSLTRNSRIFQELSVPEILEEVFGAAGFSDFKNSLQGSYDPRIYCVQYQESDLDFVSRLMEDEGIFYYFQHEEGTHTLVLADDASIHEIREGQESVPVKTQVNTASGDEIITHVAYEQQVIVGAYAMKDYDFEQPASDLGVNVEGEEATREVYEYPGGYTVKGTGEGRVKLRIESKELPMKLLRGQSHCRGFLSGYKFEMEDHLRGDFNGEYILKWVSHRVDSDRYNNSFEAFPGDVPFRPPTLTRKPHIVGSQTARVVGKSGEEIWTDEYGRVKVHFFWDREGAEDETASCWIRVAQGWAGKGWGNFFLPRIGQEVIVSFLEGDPDRPIITGSVYNAEQTVPYALPGEQTKSTMMSHSSKEAEGFNEIRFEDKADSEEIYIHGQKDMNVTIENDHMREVLNDETITVTNNRTVTVSEGDETFTVEKGARVLTVTEGDETYEVGGKRNVKVTGEEEHVNEADFTHKVSGNYTLKVDGDITIEAGGKIKMKSGTAFETEAGTAMNHKAGTAYEAKAGTSLTNKAGTTLTIDAGIKFEVKGSAMGTVDGGGMLTLKGGMVKIN